MHILFDNYAPNQQVFTPIIILKGSIVLEDREEMGECRLEAILLDTTSRSDESLLSLTKIPLKILHDKFVVVVQLVSGSNNLVFRHGEVEIGRITLELQDVGPVPKFYVRSLIVYCSDSEYEECHIGNVQDKVGVGMNLAQIVFSELLLMHEGQRNSFRIRSSDSSCEIVKLGFTRHELVTNCTTQELWEHLARQIKATPTLWSAKCKYVAFVMDPWKSVGTEANVNSTVDMQGLGGGGLAVVDGRYLEIWPCHWAQVLDRVWDQTTSNVTLDGIDNNILKGSVGHLYSKSLGGLVHELGHIFDLGHTEVGVMGPQYHHCNLIFAPSVQLGREIRKSNFKNKTISVTRLDTGQIVENTFSLTKSSSTILQHHRWFQSCHPESDIRKEICLESRTTIKSSWPLTTIELRDTTTGLVIESDIGKVANLRVARSAKMAAILTKWRPSPC